MLALQNPVHVICSFNGHFSLPLVCQVGCHDCDEQNRSICLACDTGYTLNGGKCSECPAGKTNNGGTDSTCELSKTILIVFLSKMPQLYIFKSYLDCSDHCLLCEGPNLCTRCSTGYFLNQTDTGVECGCKLMFYYV